MAWNESLLNEGQLLGRAEEPGPETLKNVQDILLFAAEHSPFTAEYSLFAAELSPVAL